MRYLFLILISLVSNNLWARETTVPVFVSGNEGHKSYQIPAIIRLNNGDLLAFTERRVNGAGDFGDINIVLKRSNDQGKTWSQLSTVDKNPGNKKSSYTAYSDIVKISKHKIGVLYEKDNYSQIVFKVVKWK